MKYFCIKIFLLVYFDVLQNFHGQIIFAYEINFITKIKQITLPSLNIYVPIVYV